MGWNEEQTRRPGKGPQLAFGWTSAEEKGCPWLNPWQLWLSCCWHEGKKKLGSSEASGANYSRARVSHLQHPQESPEKHFERHPLLCVCVLRFLPNISVFWDSEPFPSSQRALTRENAKYIRIANASPCMHTRVNVLHISVTCYNF